MKKKNVEVGKKWYHSRVIWLAVFQGVVGILTAMFAEYPALKDGAIGMIGFAVMQILIRFVTEKPIKY